MSVLSKQQLKNKIQDYISDTGKVTAGEVKELLEDLTDTLFYNIENLPDTNPDPEPSTEFSSWSDSMVWDDNLVWSEN